MRIDTKTQICALIGDPVEHSLSPAIHNAAFEVMGLNYVYLALRVREAGNALIGLRAFEQIKGFSVTIPHKVTVCSYLDWIEERASKIGAVNTIVKEGAYLKGFNTDGVGALNALKEANVEIGGKKVLLIGSGGVARSIAFSFLMEKNHPKCMYILGVDEIELNVLVADLLSLKSSKVTGKHLNAVNLKEIIENAHIVIHCTPVGMWPEMEKSLIPPALLHPDLTVFDVIYNPLKTRLLKDAELRGCQVIGGLSMFIHQAVGQFELWTGENAPMECMRRKALECLEGVSPL